MTDPRVTRIADRQKAQTAAARLTVARWSLRLTPAGEISDADAATLAAAV